MKHFSIIVFVLMFVISAQSATARVGVGIGTGKIQVDEVLKPGTIYRIPSLTVFNTGDVPSDYSISASFHEQQPELMPDKDWFRFSPEIFFLNPGQSQEVIVTLNLPVKAQPGDYFAYLEGQPLIVSDDGSTSVGVAAAAKLYFSVVPGSFIEGVYYMLLSFWNIYAPWPQRAVSVLFVGLLIFLASRFFKIEINLRQTKPKADS